MRFVPFLALAAALALAAPAAAQSTAQQMLDMAQKIRASAEQMKGKLPEADRAQMIEQAQDIEKAVRDGAYGEVDAAPPPPPAGQGLAAKIEAAHGGRLEWLAREAACAGYTQENYLTWRHSAPDRTELDQHCKNAYGHWATYLRLTRNGGDREEAETALFYYDAAAKRAVAAHGKN